MDVRWMVRQTLVTCLLLGVSSDGSNLINEKCKALISEPDNYDVCHNLSSQITLKFSKNSPPKSCGDHLQPNEAAEVPVIKWPGVTMDNSYYTIVMVDPDAPDAKTHKMRYWIHWMVTGVSGNALRNEKQISGQEPISYMGPSPPANSGPHRYQIFIFQTPLGRSLKGIPEGSSNEKRARFSLNAFIALNQFCDSLVAGYQFISENK